MSPTFNSGGGGSMLQLSDLEVNFKAAIKLSTRLKLIGALFKNSQAVSVLHAHTQHSF